MSNDYNSRNRVKENSSRMVLVYLGGFVVLIYLVLFILYAVISYLFLPEGFLANPNGLTLDDMTLQDEESLQKDLFSKLLAKLNGNEDVEELMEQFFLSTDDFDAIMDEVENGSQDVFKPKEPTVIQDTTEDPDELVQNAKSSIVYGQDKGQAESGKWFYYDRLNEDDQAVYDLFTNLCEHADEPDYAVTVQVNGPYSEEQMNYFLNDVFYMMSYDHPEYFFLVGSDAAWYCSCSSTDNETVYSFTIMNVDSSLAEKRVRFEEAADRFMSDIDLTKPDSDIELQIHDKLIDLVTYDMQLYENMLTTGSDYGHTAYGALVENSRGEANHAVCDGYSAAFQYLLGKAGIKATPVYGFGNDTSEVDKSPEKAHAWSMVCLDGEWYEVDSTWDDLDEKVNYPDDWQGIRNDKRGFANSTHHYYNLTTEHMSQTPGDPECRIDLENVYYEMRPDATSHQKNDVDELESKMMSVLPQAEGTKYQFSIEDYLNR